MVCVLMTIKGLVSNFIRWLLDYLNFYTFKKVFVISQLLCSMWRCVDSGRRMLTDDSIKIKTMALGREACNATNTCFNTVTLWILNKWF
jgi:hypothetical protein